MAGLLINISIADKVLAIESRIIKPLQLLIFSFQEKNNVIY